MTQQPRTAALSDTTLSWFERGVWALCIAVYLGVFIPGILGNGDELLVTGRAIGLTLATAVLGKFGLALLARASLPVEEGPSAEEAGPIGSRVATAPSTNVPEHKDGAESA